jgi:hypothetical protein
MSPLPRCVGDLVPPPYPGSACSLTVALPVAVPLDRLDEPASLHLRIRAIRKRRLVSRLTSACVAGAWLAVVTLLVMVGGGC